MAGPKKRASAVTNHLQRLPPSFAADVAAVKRYIAAHAA
jgi:hypothetical protein